MVSSSANVEAPPTAGVQVTEGPLAAEVPGVGILNSNIGAAARDTNAAAAGDTNAAAAEGTNGVALCELLPVMLGIGGTPC